MSSRRERKGGLRLVPGEVHIHLRALGICGSGRCLARAKDSTRSTPDPEDVELGVGEEDGSGCSWGIHDLEDSGAIDEHVLLVPTDSFLQYQRLKSSCPLLPLELIDASSLSPCHCGCGLWIGGQVWQRGGAVSESLAWLGGS